METMTLNEWVLWRNILEKLNKAAADEYRDSVWHIRGRYQGKGLGAIPRTELVDLAYSLVAKHGVSESDTEAAIRKLDELKDAYEIVKRRKSTEGIMNVNNKSDVLQESTKSAQEQGHFKKPDKVPNQTNLKGGTKVREPIIYGYCRISTPTQSIDRQVRNIKKDYPSAHIIMETYTGTTQNRRKWGWLLSQVCPGDTIVFDSVSRMSRNAEEGVSEYFALIERNITLKFLKEPYINSDVYLESKADKIELTGSDEDEIFKGLNNYFHRLAAKQIRIAFEQAEKEVSDLRQRTREGLVTAKLNGKQVGQIAGARLHVKKKAPVKEVIRKYSKDFEGTLSDADCLAIINKDRKTVCRNTYYKYKRELKNGISE